VVAVRAAAAAAAAVAEDKRSISGTFAELREQGKVHSSTIPFHFSFCVREKKTNHCVV
jgi:tryptophan synthase alpha chain